MDEYLAEAYTRMSQEKKQRTEWLAKVNVNQQPIKSVRLSWVDERHAVSCTRLTRRTLVALLAKAKNSQYDPRISLQAKLSDDYEIAALRGRKGVVCTAPINKFETVAVYEGQFVPQDYFEKTDPRNAYIMYVVADASLKGDPAWDTDDGRYSNIAYHLDPTGPVGNISMYANDAKDHKMNTKNVEFIQFTTNTGYPVIALVATRDISAGEYILTSYGDGYWKNVF